MRPTALSRALLTLIDTAPSYWLSLSIWVRAGGRGSLQGSRAQRGAPNADESRPCSRFGHPARAGSHAASMSPKAGHGAHPRRAIVAARDGAGFKGFAALACSWQIGTNSPGAKARTATAGGRGSTPFPGAARTLCGPIAPLSVRGPART